MELEVGTDARDGQASSELVANIVSHGPLGGIIIRGTTTATVREDHLSQSI